MYRTILVPLDGSEFAEHALPAAIHLARQANATLILVRSHSSAALLAPDSKFVVDCSLDDRIRETEIAYLDDVASRLSRSADIKAAHELLGSYACEAICDYAIRSHADLIVLATHGRGGLSRFWLGSMADALIRTLTIPMLLIRPQEKKPEFAAEIGPKRICIPLDGSVLAEQILEPAIELGRLNLAEYCLVRIIEPFLYPPEEFNEPVLDQLQKRAQGYLESVADRMRKRSLIVRTFVVMNEPVAEAILYAAEAQQADVVAVATHGLGGLGRALLGSVADKLIRGARLPTFVHRPVAAET